MFEKTSRIKPSSITRLHNTSPKMFFTDDQRISDLIRKAVLSTRNKHWNLSLLIILTIFIKNIFTIKKIQNKIFCYLVLLLSLQTSNQIFFSIEWKLFPSPLSSDSKTYLFDSNLSLKSSLKIFQNTDQVILFAQSERLWRSWDSIMNVLMPWRMYKFTQKFSYDFESRWFALIIAPKRPVFRVFSKSALYFDQMSCFSENLTPCNVSCTKKLIKHYSV